MYRVELQVTRSKTTAIRPKAAFLMYRVELKAWRGLLGELLCPVPNAPCGVEGFKRRREALSLQAVLSQLCRMQTVGGGKGLNS